jgi:hypothetical protein
MVILVVAGSAAEMLPVSFSFLLPLQRTHPPLFCCLRILAEMGATSTASGRLIDESLSIRKFGREEPLWYKFLFWLPQESGDFA